MAMRRPSRLKSRSMGTVTGLRGGAASPAYMASGSEDEECCRAATRLAYRFDAASIYLAQQVVGAAVRRDHDVRRHVQQRDQHESALVHARMRQLQAFAGELAVAVQQQVQIETARAPALLAA